MNIFYECAIHLYGTFLKIASIFHPKAKKWIRGRKNWKAALIKEIGEDGHWIWFHCASLGEFEQGRNLIEAVKKDYPYLKILLTFFSPSGYEIRKNYRYADAVCYLPLDTKHNVQAFLEIVRPKLVVFIKYELWLNYIQEISNRNIPLLLVSARFQADSSFLKSIFAPLYRKAFLQMAAIFTQDEPTARLLEDFTHHPNIYITSDTRYDRVFSNKQEFSPINEVETFKRNRLCIVCGSTWPKGEKVLFESWEILKEKFDICLILAPHEINQSRIQQWVSKYPDISIQFSKIDQLTAKHSILWIDNIGMLSKLYHYADIAYVGGAWRTGLHNILEAVVFGCPVIIGPDYKKFPEAGDLITAGGGFSIKTTEEMNDLLLQLLTHETLRKNIREKNEKFIQNRIGATEKVLAWCRENELIK